MSNKYNAHIVGWLKRVRFPFRFQKCLDKNSKGKGLIKLIFCGLKKGCKVVIVLLIIKAFPTRKCLTCPLIKTRKTADEKVQKEEFREMK